MTQAKPTPGPVFVETIHIRHVDGNMHIVQSNYPDPEIICYVLCHGPHGEARPRSKPNTELIASAFNAAHAAAELGYDPIEAVKALPGLLKEAETWAGWHSAEAKKILAAARGEDRQPG